MLAHALAEAQHPVGPGAPRLKCKFFGSQAAYINPLVYGNVAFIRRGGCNLVTKFANAISKGAPGCCEKLSPKTCTAL